MVAWESPAVARLCRGRWMALLFVLVSMAGDVASAADTPPQRPNILFAIADDWSFPHAGAYGCTWVKTPGFDRVAREGVLFTRAYTPNAKCAPSRACILTGRNSWQLKEAANHIPYFPAEFKSFVEALADHEYTVGMTAKGWGPGIANDKDGKPRQMTGKAFNARKLKPLTSGITPNDYAGNFEDFLATTQKDEPWCFWYGSLEPHRGYEYGSGVAKGGKKTSDIDRVPAFWPDNDVVRNDMLDYALETEHFDAHLSRMLDLLEKRGELANTIVLVTADNGMPFPRAKGQEYELSNHLPLAIMWPRGIKGAGRRVDDYVSFIDFAPTFIEAAGLKPEQSGMAPMTGRSLFDIFASDKSGQVIATRDHVLIGKERHDVGRPGDQGYPIRGMVKGNRLFLMNFETGRYPAGNPLAGYPNVDAGATKTEILKNRENASLAQFWQMSFGFRPAEEMYDLSRDVDCINNLAYQTEHQAAQRAMKEQLIARLKEQGDPRMSGNGKVFDDYEYADKKFKGLYDRLKAGEAVVPGWINKSDMQPEAEK